MSDEINLMKQDRKDTPLEKNSIVHQSDILPGTIKKRHFDKNSVIDAIYPVGAIYLSVVSTSPATLFGGTWVAFGAGKTLVGLDSGDTDFDTVEETGGAKADSHSHYTSTSFDGTTIYIAESGEISAKSKVVTKSRAVATKSSSATAPTRADGTDETASSTVQPYITVYMWKRTA